MIIFLWNEMKSGVKIYNPVLHEKQVTMPSVIKPIDERSFSLTIRQGLNRQIRRMTDSLGYRVEALKRVRIMHINLDDLPVGSLALFIRF